MLRSVIDSATTHFILALGFSITTVVLYLHLFPTREPFTIDLDALQGEYAVRFKDQCFGTLHVSTELTDELTTLKAEGTFLLSQKNVEIPVKTTAEANFNILGQFGNAITTFELGDSTLRAGALGIDPIQIIIHSSQGTKNTFQREFNVPGPILGRRVNGHYLAIEYQGLSERGLAIPATGISLSKGAAPECNKPLPLDAVVKNLMASLPSLPIPIENLIPQP